MSGNELPPMWKRDGAGNVEVGKFHRRSEMAFPSGRKKRQRGHFGHGPAGICKDIRIPLCPVSDISAGLLILTSRPVVGLDHKLKCHGNGFLRDEAPSNG